LQIHKPGLSCPDPSKWPRQAAISWDSVLQYRRIKAFYEAFSQPKVCAIAAGVPFSSTKVNLTALDSKSRGGAGWNFCIQTNWTIKGQRLWGG